MIFTLFLFFIIPVIFWYINDAYYLYIYHTTQNTIISDFGSVLFTNGLLPHSVIDRPWTMDFSYLLILTSVSIHRIVLFDVLMALLLGLIMVIFMQFNYIYTYFKSKLKSDFRDRMKEENNTIYSFNN